MLAFSSYKYVGMITVLLLGLLGHNRAYYFGLLYASVSLAFFLIRALKLRIEPEVNHMGNLQVD